MIDTAYFRQVELLLRVLPLVDREAVFALKGGTAINFLFSPPSDGTPTARVIVKGANSFITPEARTFLQGKGIVVLRDASANKCGVISSSYEIIANLLLREKEFLAHKEECVKDVLTILQRRAANEAELILRRHGEANGKQTY